MKSLLRHRSLGPRIAGGDTPLPLAPLGYKDKSANLPKGQSHFCLRSAFLPMDDVKNPKDGP